MIAQTESQRLRDAAAAAVMVARVAETAWEAAGAAYAAAFAAEAAYEAESAREAECEK